MNYKLLFEIECEATQLKDMQLGHLKRDNLKLTKKVEEQDLKLGAYKTLVLSKNLEIVKLENIIEELPNKKDNKECTEMLKKMNKFLDTNHTSIDIYA
jgi:hypothetical protein